MTKSLIEQELEGKYGKYKRRCLLCPDEYCSDYKHIPSWVWHCEDVNSAIEKAREELRKKSFCMTHIGLYCHGKSETEICKFGVKLSDIEKVFGK